MQTDTKVLALDIGGTKLAAGIGHGNGEITRQLSEPTLAQQGADSVLERAIALARRCAEAELMAGGQLESVGVSSMGYTFATHTELAPNVPGWDRLSIPGAIGSAFTGLPVAIGNDVQVAAQAEVNWGSLREVRDGIYLNLGSGISAGIILDGRLRHGAHGAAGEVGYTLFRGLDERQLAADGVATFEAWFGGAGAARRLAASGLPGSIAEVVARRHEDPNAGAFVQELWAGIGVMVANFCSALDPAVLSLGGGYMRQGAGDDEDSELIACIETILARAVPHPPSVLRARFGADASLRGAAAIALEAIKVAA